jgi:hypothetical protein
METADYIVDILYEGDSVPCMVRVQHRVSGGIMLDDVFSNALIASANLRDAVGFSVACEVLDELCISPNSALWDLNHSRPHARLAILDPNEAEYVSMELPSEEYELIAAENFSSYEWSVSFYLYQRGSYLYTASAHYPDCGNEPYDQELHPIRYSEWLRMIG